MSFLSHLYCTDQALVGILKTSNLKDDHNVIFTTIDVDSAIIITDDNVCLVPRVIIFDKIIFLKSYRTPCKTTEEFMDIDTRTYFIPKSSSLLDILRKRASDMEFTDVSYALIKETNNDKLRNSDIMEMNKWLHKNGLLDYKFVLLSDIDKRNRNFDKKNTIVDRITVGDRSYNLWVKEVVEYYVPESIPWLKDLSAVANKDNWSIYDTTIVTRDQTLYAFEFLVTLEMTREYFYIGAVIMYPEKIIVGKNSSDVLEKFLSYLEELVYNSTTQIILAGFHNEFLENVLLKRLLSCVKDWVFTRKNLIHLKTGTEIKLFDTSIFFPPSTKNRYVRYWSDKEIKYKNYFSKKLHLEKYLQKDVTNRIHYLYVSIQNHISYMINKFELPSFNYDFSGLFDILLFRTRAITNKNIYYPQHFSAISTLIDSIYADYYFVSEVNSDSRKLMFKSIFPLISDQFYPEGRPSYSEIPNSERLSICLCEIEICKNTTHPILYSKRDRYAKKFIGVFTSVDIDTAVALGGYKINILGCLEWPRKSKFFEMIPYSELLSEDTDCILSYLARGNITEDVVMRESMQNHLPIITFIVSYCRSYIHKLLDCPTYKSSKTIVKYKYNQIIYRDSQNTS